MEKEPGEGNQDDRKEQWEGLPWGPMVKTPGFDCMGHRFDT